MAPITRRRRVGRSSDPQPCFVAVPPPRATRRNQDQDKKPFQNPDWNQIDLISDLPEYILSSILLFLPIRDAIRTSILSSRWRDIWKLNPLHFDDVSISSHLGRGVRTSRVISSIASVHPGPIHSFRISQLARNGEREHGEVDSVIETLTRKGIRDFDLRFGYKGRLRYRIPASLLQCQSLCKVSLSECYFPPSPVVNSGFPNLKELTLEFVFLWDDLLHCLLKSCSKLEVLQLITCTGLQHVRINCAKLQKLTIHECGSSYIKQLAIENAPELQSLRIGEKTADYTRISMQDVRKLEVLGFLSMDATMKIGSTFSKPHNKCALSVNECNKLPTVKNLAILVGFGNELKCSLLASVLRCLPSLETLDIKCTKSIGPGPDVGYWKQQIPFDFLDQHLKSVSMINFVGLKAEVEFLKHVVQHGRVLERITIICEHKLTATWEKKKRRELRLTNRTSRDLEVVFLHNSNIDSDSCEWAPLLFYPILDH